MSNVASRIAFGGRFTVQCIRNGDLVWEDHCDNIVPNEGLTKALNLMGGVTAQIANWYIGLFSGNYTPIAGDTAATFPANATEFTNYAESTRQSWTIPATTGQSLTNSASVAVFTSLGTETVRGAFISSSSVKGGTTGTLLAASRLPADRSVLSGDTISITYVFGAQDA